MLNLKGDLIYKFADGPAFDSRLDWRPLKIAAKARAEKQRLDHPAQYAAPKVFGYVPDLTWVGDLSITPCPLSTALSRQKGDFVFWLAQNAKANSALGGACSTYDSCGLDDQTLINETVFHPTIFLAWPYFLKPFVT